LEKTSFGKIVKGPAAELGNSSFVTKAYLIISYVKTDSQSTFANLTLSTGSCQRSSLGMKAEKLYTCGSYGLY
jgi:hypothetical protein